MARVTTGCHNCKRCTNSHAADFGRRQGKLWANLLLVGIPIMVQAFSANCRGCGHKLSLHNTAGPERGNSYATPVAQRP